MTCECDACERMHQWDSNQTVDFDGKTGETVDFATDDAGTAVTVKAENGAAKVPAELLQQTDAIKAYLRNDGNTVAEKTICVEGRAKPSDYVADPTDQLTASEAIDKAQAAAKESASSASYAKDSADAAMQFAAETAGSAEDAADSASKAAASAAAAKEAAENPVLPIASASALGAIKVGENLSIAEDGTLNAQAGGGTVEPGAGMKLDDNGNLAVNVGNGLAVNKNTNMLEVPVSDGLGYTTNGIEAKLGDGLSFDASGNVKSDVNVISPKTVGMPPTASGVNSIAIGYGAQASGPRSVALGVNAKATSDNSIAIGYNSAASAANVVSFGNASTNRRIVNVGKPINQYDAANKEYVDSSSTVLKQVDMSSVGVVAKNATVDITDETIVAFFENNLFYSFGDSNLFQVSMYVTIDTNVFLLSCSLIRSNDNGYGFNMRFILNVSDNNYTNVYVYLAISDDGESIVRVKNEGNYDISDLKIVAL